MTSVYYEDEYALLDGFREFSFKHIALGDLDPIYTMVRNARMTESKKKRFIFSHLMVYDLKSSIALADESNDELFYDKVLNCFQSDKVGKDRKDVASRETNIKSRTFGTQIPKMRLKSPEAWVDFAYEETNRSKNWGLSLQASKEVPTFGEYFGFKLADMIETVFDIDGYKVAWTEDFVKSLPRGALTGYEMVLTGSKSKFRSKDEIRNCPTMEKFYKDQLEFFSNVRCPQQPNRSIGVQEVETLLCDYRKVTKGTLQYGDKVLKLKQGIDHNKGLTTSEELFEGAKALFERRQMLLDRGLSTIGYKDCLRVVGEV